MKTYNKELEFINDAGLYVFTHYTDYAYKITIVENGQRIKLGFRQLECFNSSIEKFKSIHNLRLK